MALTKKDRQQLYGLLIVVAVVAAVLFWMYWRTPKLTEISAMQVEIDSLRRRVDSAKADLRQGTVEQLRQRVDVYERSLDQMRLLVPTENEVTTLIDQVSTRAQLRGVDIATITPLSNEFSPPFEVHRYRFTATGSYDEIGEFLTDIASLERIMVPYEVGLSPQPEACPREPDVGKTCLEVSFLLKTFVKGGTVSGEGGDTGGTP